MIGFSYASHKVSLWVAQDLVCPIQQPIRLTLSVAFYQLQRDAILSIDYGVHLRYITNMNTCPYCNSNQQSRDGFTNSGTQRYRCRTCGKRYVSEPSRRESATRKLATEVARRRKRGQSLRAIAAALGVSHQTVSNIEKSLDGRFVYMVKKGDLYKIGKTTSTHSRMSAIRPTEIVMMARVDTHTELELELIRMYDSKRVGGEWFRLTADDVAGVLSHAVSRGATLEDVTQ